MFVWPDVHPLVIAHRGARSLAPEETLAAAKKALSLGADMWEFDVHTLGDGTVVLCHDATLERTTDVVQKFPNRRPWRLADFTWEEVQGLDAGSWFVRQDPFGTLGSGEVTPDQAAEYIGERVLRLEEALAFVKAHNWRAMVEVKDETGLPGDAIIVERVVDAVMAVGLETQVVIASFNARYLERARARSDRITTLLLSAEALPDPVSRLEEVGATVYGPALTAVVPEQVEALHEAGYRVFVWTVNDLDSMRRLVALGVDGIITDYPQRLIALLRSLGLQPGAG